MISKEKRNELYINSERVEATEVLKVPQNNLKYVMRCRKS